MNLTAADIQQISVVIGKAWKESTLAAYGSGLLNYHVFCDQKSIPEEERAPGNPTLISTFIASIAGMYSGSTIDNDVYGIRTWHILHGVRWQMETAELEAILWAAEKTTPHTSRKKKRVPYTPNFIIAVGGQLELKKPQDATVYGCLTTTFYAAGCLGELRCRTLVPLTNTGTSNHPTSELSTTTMAFTQWFSTYTRPRCLIRVKTPPGQDNQEAQTLKLPSTTLTQMDTCLHTVTKTANTTLSQSPSSLRQWQLQQGRLVLTCIKDMAPTSGLPLNAY